MKVLSTILSIASFAVTASANGHVMTASLTSAEGVSSSASGSVTFLYSAATASILYTMDINNPDGLNMLAENGANLHCGSIGSGPFGNVIVNLVPAGADDSPLIGALPREITADDLNENQCALTIEGLWNFMTTTGAYVTVSSQENPDGELRANLPGLEEGEVVEGTLSGDSSTASGNVTFVYSPTAETIVFAMSISNPDGLGILGGNNGASLHCGSTAPSGNIVVDLVEAEENTDAEIGATKIITEDDIQPQQCVITIPNLWAFMTSSGSTYVTVDSTESPDGELRADLPEAEPVPTNPPTAMPTSVTMVPTAMPGNVTMEPTLAPSKLPTSASGALTASISLGILLLH